jgi:hypothetical protein
MVEAGIGNPATPSLSALGYDLMDDLSVNSQFLDTKTFALINSLERKREQNIPISLINFDGILKYFEENPGIDYFADEHHLALVERIVADAANLVGVWNRLSLFVETNGPEYGKRNIFRVFSLLKNYLIKTEHHLSILFQNEVYDDELSNASRAEEVRGDDSTICSDEQIEEDLEPIESTFSADGIYFDNEYGLDLDEETAVDDSEIATKVQSPPPAPTLKFPEVAQNEIEQLQQIQLGLRLERKRIGFRFMFSSSPAWGRVYKPVFNSFTRYAPTEPSIEEIKKSDSEDPTIEEID